MSKHTPWLGERRSDAWELQRQLDDKTCHNAERLGFALDRGLEQAQTPEQVAMRNLIEHWPSLVDERFANGTTPARLEKGTLYCEVRTSSHMMMLAGYVGRVTQVLRKQVPLVKQVRLIPAGSRPGRQCSDVSGQMSVRGTR